MSWSSNGGGAPPPSEDDPLLPVANGAENAMTTDYGGVDQQQEGEGDRPHDRRRPGQHHHRRDSSLGAEILDVIHEGVAYVEEVAQAVAENVAEGVHVAAESFIETVSEGAHTFHDSVVEEAEAVVEAAVEEMEHADEGQGFFLEMSLARNLSILPEDVVHIAETDVATVSHPTEELQPEEAAGEEAEEPVADEEETELMGLKIAAEEEIPKPEPPRPARMHISAYLLLLSAVVSLSSIGPLLVRQEGCTSLMKVFWRTSATAAILLPFALHQTWKEGLPNWNCPQVTTMCLSAVCYATMCAGFVIALDYTAVGNAVILSNSQAIMLLVSKFLVGDPVTVMEGSGALTAFAGAILCSKDSADEQSGSPQVRDGASPTMLTLVGDFYGLLAGVGGCGYLVFAKRARAHIGLYVFMFVNMFIGCLFVLMFMTLAMGEVVTFDRNELTGVWGWLNLTFDRLPLELMMVVVWYATHFFRIVIQKHYVY